MAAIGVFCASSGRIEQRWLDLAYQVGLEIGRRGHTLVSGGGRVGMMGRLAVGARAGGAYTFGVIPQSLVDLEVADIDSDELIVTTDMASRKALMMEKSDGFLVLPGGLGTLDELFEVWTTATLRIHAKPVVLLDAGGFYAGLCGWLADLASAAFARPEAIEMVHVVPTLAEALDSFDKEAPGGRGDVPRPVGGCRP